MAVPVEVIKEKDCSCGGNNHQQMAAPSWGVQYIDMPVPICQPAVYPPISEPYEAMEFVREVHPDRRDYRREYDGHLKVRPKPEPSALSSRIDPHAPSCLPDSPWCRAIVRGTGEPAARRAAHAPAHAA